MKLFSFRCSAFVDEKLVEIPGFSHRSQPFEQRVLWYPWTEHQVRAFVFARHRRHATKQIERRPD